MRVACREDASKVFNPKEGAEKFTFQAEVNRLMDIIIHSLYSNKVRCLSARVTPPWDSSSCLLSPTEVAVLGGCAAQAAYPCLLQVWSLAQ